MLADLNDIRFGEFEGRQLDEYRDWARTHGPADPCPGGGESRLDAAARYTDAFAAVLARPERTVLVIAHGLPIRYVLDAADGLGLTRNVEPIDYAEPHRLNANQLSVAVEGLRAWLEEPVFA